MHWMRWRAQGSVCMNEYIGITSFFNFKKFFQGHSYLSNFSSLKFLVLDEADKMVEVGHYKDLWSITNKLNGARESKFRKNLVYSATLTLPRRICERRGKKYHASTCQEVMGACVCTSMCTSVYIHVCVHVYTYMHVCICTCVCMHVCAWKDITSISIVRLFRLYFDLLVHSGPPRDVWPTHSLLIICFNRIWLE